ncbi:hypothetical protein [Streptomyces sp.]|uniref:hypothetical protein n=1 Tax=Streptomyces sp. TaxID=1931 RepID=UPI002F92F8F4
MSAPLRTLIGPLGLLAVSAAVWAVLRRRAARPRRTGPAQPLDRVWHPQESVPLTPAEEEAFDEVVSRWTFGARR